MVKTEILTKLSSFLGLDELFDGLVVEPSKSEVYGYFSAVDLQDGVVSGNFFPSCCFVEVESVALEFCDRVR